MSNKDSFTFSDKLKRSKSLPLSKRIPSKVGGDGKAKRTLIQRAQRDLPFIIVAAAALLLLPILSREPKTGFEGRPDYDGLFTGESVAGLPTGPAEDLRPSTFRNPLEMIMLPKSGQDGEGIKMLDPYGEDEPSTKYAAPDTPAVRPTTVYQPAAGRSVRASAPRAATVVGALRSSQMTGAGGRSGANITLATGTAPRGGAAAAPREGVRPVALQPLQSAGRGGRGGFEDGYGEMARSLMAMNKGPAKQAIFAAQLGDVDGTPLGAAGYGRDARGRDGVGGAPNNRVDHKSYLPWWWDFEKMKAMKRWELWHYNWEKALSDSLIKMATGIFQCLTIGKADGTPGNFIGTPAGDDSDICVDADGNPLKGARNFNDWSASLKTTSGDTSGTSATWEGYMLYCKSKGGAMNPDGTAKTGIDASSYKGFFQTRLRCLGGRWGEMALGKLFASMKKTEIAEADNCNNVDDSSGIIKFNAKTTSKALIGKGSFQDRRVGHYVVMVDANKQDARYKVDLSAHKSRYDADGNLLPNDSAQTAKNKPKKDKKNKNSDTPETQEGSGDTSGAQSAAQDSAGKAAKELSDRDSLFKNGFIGFIGAKGQLDGEALNAQIKRLNANHPDSDFRAIRVVGFIGDQEKVQQYLPGLIAEIKDYGMLTISEPDLQKQLGINKNRTAICNINMSFLHTEFSNFTHRGTKNDTTPTPCGPSEVNKQNIEPMSIITSDRVRLFSATIKNPGRCVYAVFVERSDNVNFPFMVKKVTPFMESAAVHQKNQGTNLDSIGNCTEDENGNKTCTYTYQHTVATSELTKLAESGQAPASGVAWEIPYGFGSAIWITDDNVPCEELPNKYNKKYKKDESGNYIGAYVDSTATKAIMGDLYNSKGEGQKWAECTYKWGCDAELCPQTSKGDYCYDVEGKLFKAHVESGLALKTGEEVAFEKVFGQEPDTPNCTTCITDTAKAKNMNVPMCDIVCKDENGALWPVETMAGGKPKLDDGKAIIRQNARPIAGGGIIETELVCKPETRYCKYEDGLYYPIAIIGHNVFRAAGARGVSAGEVTGKIMSDCTKICLHELTGNFMVRGNDGKGQQPSWSRDTLVGGNVFIDPNCPDCNPDKDVTSSIVAETGTDELQAVFQVSQHAPNLMFFREFMPGTIPAQFTGKTVTNTSTATQYTPRLDTRYQRFRDIILIERPSLYVTITGHASFDGPEATKRESNVRLSQGRAITAANSVIAQLQQDLKSDYFAKNKASFVANLNRMGAGLPSADDIYAKINVSVEGNFPEVSSGTKGPDVRLNMVNDGTSTVIDGAMLENAIVAIAKHYNISSKERASLWEAYEKYRDGDFLKEISTGGSQGEAATGRVFASGISGTQRRQVIQESESAVDIPGAAKSLVELFALVKLDQQKIFITVDAKGDTVPFLVDDPTAGRNQRIELKSVDAKDGRGSTLLQAVIDDFDAAYNNAFDSIAKESQQTSDGSSLPIEDAAN